MGEATKIEWTDSTFNPWIGCTKIAPACDHCYAADMAKRYGWVEWGNAPRKRTSEALWRNPLKWQKDAAAFFVEHLRRRRVFCASLADVFDNQVPAEWRVDLWKVIYNTPDLDWLLLTKRPQNIADMLPPTAFWNAIRGHVWLGTTVEDQKHADQNIPHLLKHSAAVHFVSVEPMLGPIDLTQWLEGREEHGMVGQCIGWTPPLEWVIAGGESGPHARPSHPDWFRDLRDQCAAAGVPFLFKQWGEWASGENAARAVTKPERAAWLHDEATLDWHIRAVGRAESEEMHRDDEPDVWRLGKSQAGRKLDGVQHDGFPVAA